MSRQRGLELADGGEPLWSARGWLHAETLQSLAEVNEQCLELMCEQAAVRQGAGGGSRGEADGFARGGRPAAIFVQLRELWSELDPAARRRAAHCPCLLVDAGFAEAGRWTRVLGGEVHDEARFGAASPCFTVPRAVAVTRLVVTYAWHLARSQMAAARLLLGLSERCAELIGGCTLSQVTRVAESHVQWLAPRWVDRVAVWRELLATASSGEHAALERIHMRGVQLLAADARTGGSL